MPTTPSNTSCIITLQLLTGQLLLPFSPLGENPTCKPHAMQCATWQPADHPHCQLRSCCPLHPVLTMHPCARVLLPLAQQESPLLCWMQLHVLAMRKSSRFR